MHLLQPLSVCFLLGIAIASPVKTTADTLTPAQHRNAALGDSTELNKRAWMSYDNIDGSATAGAKVLLKFIQSQFGWHYLSGQQDPTSFAWVKSQIGKTPAILGSDFIDYSPSRVAHGTSSTAVEDAIAFDGSGGINTFVWHWNAPTEIGRAHV